MVPERDLSDPALRDGGVERAAAQLRAQRAGVGLPALLEHDLVDRHLHAHILHAKRAAKLPHGCKIHTRRAAVDRQRGHLKALGVKGFEPRERGKRQERILPAGDADGYGLPLLYHVIVLNASADKP